MKTSLILLWIFLGLTISQAEIIVTETLKDQAGKILPQILVRATPTGQNTATAVEARTDDQGTFSLTLADGEWFVEVDQAELLARGYFCVPGSCLSPTCPISIIPAVPLSPTLNVSRSLEGGISIVADFDWTTGVDPFIYRQFRIERSVDLTTWEPVGSILLSNPPIRLVDLKAAGAPCTYYRAMPEADFQVRPFDWTTIVFTR